MDRAAIESIREALSEARAVAHRSLLHECDVNDLDEVIAPAEAELQADRPNVQTLSTYLNSVARSLRADPAGRAVCLQLDAAMRRASIPTDWEH